MTDEEPVPPLDAYATAKPDEPTFTLQGGDPLTPLLIELWVVGARGLTGLPPNPSDNFVGRWIDVQEANQVTDAREVENLQLRATEAEKVLWRVQAYQRGNPGADKPMTAGGNFLDEAARLDLYDVRLRGRGKVDNAAHDLLELQQKLADLGYEDAGTLERLGLIAGQLRQIGRHLEYRRLMKGS